MTYVLDTSAILSRKFNITGSDVIIPSSVVDEIRKGRLKYVLDAASESMRIMTPSDESLDVVREKAGKSGDLKVLSSTDVDVIALAYETGSTVVSDDYAIQNVASMLSVEFTGADLSGIRKEVVWKYRCTGCRKMYDRPIGSCPVCGHEVVRSRFGNPKH